MNHREKLEKLLSKNEKLKNQIAKHKSYVSEKERKALTKKKILLAECLLFETGGSFEPFLEKLSVFLKDADKKLFNL